MDGLAFSPSSLNEEQPFGHPLPVDSCFFMREKEDYAGCHALIGVLYGSVVEVYDVLFSGRAKRLLMLSSLMASCLTSTSS